MKLIDRLMVRGYLKAYTICLVSLLSLYIVVDLFTNLDDFTEHHRGFWQVMKHIGIYYGYKTSQIFDRLCEPIVLLAATFTVAWIQRSNELMPLLSAGVPTRRVVRPILLTACLMLCFSVANQELIIPRIGNFLTNPRDDPTGTKETAVCGAYDTNGVHIEGRSGSRQDLVVKEFYVVIPENVARSLISLNAQQAQYKPPVAGDPRSGGWLLSGTVPAKVDWKDSAILEMIDPGKYFLKTQQVDFDSITRNSSWFNFASTARLCAELSRPDSLRLGAMAVLFHMRMTRPLLGIILVLLGLSVILRDQNRNVFISAGLCMVLCGLFFATQFACKQIGEHNYLSPALSAWLPVLVFGPLSFSLFDAMHT